MGLCLAVQIAIFKLGRAFGNSMCPEKLRFGLSIISLAKACKVTAKHEYYVEDRRENYISRIEKTSGVDFFFLNS
jgi:hypothetical protein